MKWLVAAVPALALVVGSSAPGAAVRYRFADPRITEASGIAPGLASPGVDYVQNDSGGGNHFFAVDERSGATVATIAVPGAENVDWEDIAVARDRSGAASIWLADIGDNDAVRREVDVYRLPEPRLAATARNRSLKVAPSGVWRLRYPSGPTDAESLAVAPGGTAYVITKSPLGRSTVYRLPAAPNARRVQLLTAVGRITFTPTGTKNPFGLPGELAATSAAFSADGTVLAVRTYADAYFWTVRRGDVAAALRTAPVRIALPDQPQGEGIAVRGQVVLVDSEGRHSAVYAVPVPARPASPPSRTAGSRTAGPAAVGPPAPGGSDWRWPVFGGGLAVLLAGLAYVGRRIRGRRPAR